MIAEQFLSLLLQRLTNVLINEYKVEQIKRVCGIR